MITEHTAPPPPQNTPSETSRLTGRSLPSFFLLWQDRHSVVKRGEGDSPPSTSPNDTNQTFKFSPGDGQALQVRPPAPIRLLCCCSDQTNMAESVFHLLSSDQPTPRYPPTAGPRQSQEWREAGGAVSCHHPSSCYKQVKLHWSNSLE